MKTYFNKIVTLFAHGNPSETIRQEFYQWLVDEEHTPEKDQALRELWKEACVPSSAGQKRRTYPMRIWQIAAALFFMLTTLSICLYMSEKETKEHLIQQYIPVAQTRTLTLPDGSRVQLNSQSTLLYPQQFTGSSRSVYLIGEANFKVKPDKKQPFIVKSADFQATALGTEFNIAAYPEEQVIAATLISGSILVEYNSLNDRVVLKPNEQLAYNKCTREHNLNRPDMNDVTAWQRNELVFREMTIKEIITKLERKYPYTFVYSLKDLKDDKYNFRFKNNAPLSEVMEVIVKVTGHMKYKIESDSCYLILR